MPTERHTDCHLVERVRDDESGLITDMVAALRHLERIARTAGTPTEEAAHYEGRADTAMFRGWVLGNDQRIRQLLDTITTPYTTT